MRSRPAGSPPRAPPVPRVRPRAAIWVHFVRPLPRVGAARAPVRALTPAGFSGGAAATRPTPGSACATLSQGERSRQAHWVVRRRAGAMVPGDPRGPESRRRQVGRERHGRAGGAPGAGGFGRVVRRAARRRRLLGPRAGAEQAGSRPGDRSTAEDSPPSTQRGDNHPGRGRRRSPGRGPAADCMTPPPSRAAHARDSATPRARAGGVWRARDRRSRSRIGARAGGSAAAQATGARTGAAQRGARGGGGSSVGSPAETAGGGATGAAGATGACAPLSAAAGTFGCFRLDAPDLRSFAALEPLISKLMRGRELGSRCRSRSAGALET